MAVELAGRLSQALGWDRPLPATLIYDYPTVEAMAAYLDGRLSPAAGPPDRAAEIGALSDAEVETLLEEKLARL
jgi:hypothetical protein